MKRKAQYPVNLVFATVLQANDGPKKAAADVIRDETELRAVLPREASALSTSIDFEKEQLIFVALGKRESGGYEVQINDVTHLADRGLVLPPLTVVSYRERFYPGSVPFEEKKVTCPIHVIKIAKVDGETVFVSDKKG